MSESQRKPLSEPCLKFISKHLLLTAIHLTKTVMTLTHGKLQELQKVTNVIRLNNDPI